MLAWCTGSGAGTYPDPSRECMGPTQDRRKAETLQTARRAPAVLAAVMLVSLVAIACGIGSDISEEEVRIQRLNKAIMCPVCPGESIDQSQNELAAAMREIVAKQVREGRTDEEIKAYFVESYDASLLMEPPREGFNLLVWLLPPAAAAGALLALLFALRLMSRPAASEEIEPRAVLSDDERSEYYRRIEGVLEYDQPTPPEPRGGEEKA